MFSKLGGGSGGSSGLGGALSAVTGLLGGKLTFQVPAPQFLSYATGKILSVDAAKKLRLKYISSSSEYMFLFFYEYTLLINL